MPSDEFREYYATVLAAMARTPPPVDLAERRTRMEEGYQRLPIAEGVRLTSLDAHGVGIIACTREESRDDPVVLHFHGGGYRQGSAGTHRSFGSHLALACSVEVLLVDYRLAPEHPFPAAVDDALDAYRWLFQAAEPPKHVIIAGDSAGGGLAAALALRVRDEALPLPSGVVCLSPWTDLANTGASYVRCADTDPLFSKSAADEVAANYLQGADPADPLASPLRGDWSGLSPLLILASDAEVLADDATGLAEAARRAGVDVELHVYAGMPHVWPLNYPKFPEAVQAFDEISAFVARVTRG